MFSHILGCEKLCFWFTSVGMNAPLLPRGSEPVGHFDTGTQPWIPHQAIAGVDTAFYSYLNLVVSKKTGSRVHVLALPLIRL